MIAPPDQLLLRHGLSAKKPWGQNFLRDADVRARIVAASGAGPDAELVEIGAGLGTLTAELLDAGARVWAIERDRDLCGVLRAELGDRPGFELLEADAVRFDYSALPCTRPTIVGNLPYHLTGPLLFALLRHHEHTGPWVVMVQREVADRVCAAPGSRTYGGVTVALGRVRRVERVIEVPPHAFVPAPRVWSTVLRFCTREPVAGTVADHDQFLRLVRSAFQKRRKTLRNALLGVGTREQVERWIASAGLEPGIRPERLDAAAFAALQRAREAEPDPG